MDIRNFPATAAGKGSRRGFTLTEVAITLAVIGLLLGAIWVAASSVMNNNNVKSALQDTAFILNNYRSLYAVHGVDVANLSDITCVPGVKDGFFPQSMSQSGTCTTGNTATYPENPWSGFVEVGAYSTTTPQGISIEFGGLNQGACEQFADALFNSPDILYEDAGTESVNLPPWGTGTPLTPVQVADGCQKGSNNVGIVFKAR